MFHVKQQKGDKKMYKGIKRNRKDFPPPPKPPRTISPSDFIGIKMDVPSNDLGDPLGKISSNEIKSMSIDETKIILSEEIKDMIKQQVKEAVERGIDDYIDEFKEKERLLKENEYLATELEEKTEQLAHLQNEFNMWKKHMVEINEQK